MARSRASAKQAGTRFERQIADYLNDKISLIRKARQAIDRLVKTGNKDRGDIGGVITHGQLVAIECKDVARWKMAEWLREAEVERDNYEALAGVVIAKRVGVGKPGQQAVIMTVDTFIALLTGQKVDEL